MNEQELDQIESNLKTKLEELRTKNDSSIWGASSLDREITGIWEMAKILTNCIRSNLKGDPVLTYSFRYEENKKESKKV